MTLGAFSINNTMAEELNFDVSGNQTQGSTNSSSFEGTNTQLTEEEKKRLQSQNAFNNAVKDFSEGDARLGNELASLPGPNISFNDLLRVIITWSASLAASVAIFIFVLRSFAAISGTEEAHNQWKSSILKILIGLVLIFFSYQIIAFVMGILWAT